MEGVFSTTLFALSLLAGVLYHAGMNVMNDYFDHLNGSDVLNESPLSPYAGGSRMIQNHSMTPAETFSLGTLCLVAGSLIGLYLASLTGWGLLLIGLIGLSTGLFYSAPPVFFAGRGLGELVVGLNFGVLSVAGSFFVQTGTMRWEVVVISLPLSFLIAAVLYINQFPDYAPDMAAGKRNLVVRLGPESARRGLVVILTLAYASIALGAALTVLTPLSLVALAPVVFAWKGAERLMRALRDGQKLAAQKFIPSIKSIIIAHLATGILLVASQIF